MTAVNDPAGFHRPPQDILRRALALFDMAEDEVLRGWSRRPDPDSDYTKAEHLQRAQILADVTSAGARVAQAMVGLQHLDLLREFEERVDARATADENGQPDAFPCPNCDQVFELLTALDRHLAVEHGIFVDSKHRRFPKNLIDDPYDPPTLSGPYDPDRTHDR